MSVRVKICGIKDAAGFDAAVGAGADWVGFNFFRRSPRMDRSRGCCGVVCPCCRWAGTSWFVRRSDGRGSRRGAGRDAAGRVATLCRAGPGGRRAGTVRAAGMAGSRDRDRPLICQPTRVRWSGWSSRRSRPSAPRGRAGMPSASTGRCCAAGGRLSLGRWQEDCHRRMSQRRSWSPGRGQSMCRRASSVPLGSRTRALIREFVAAARAVG